MITPIQSIQSILGGLGVALCVLAVALHVTPTNPGCKAKKAEAAISARAAEICTGTLAGCSLTYAEVRGLLADARAAEDACGPGTE